MMIYIEACYSGSIFKELPTNIDVIVMTAASPNENSWSCYCDEIGFGEVCLGDQLACAWMEHTEQVDPSTTPVGIQVDYVQTMVDLSAVCLFGDTRLFESMIGEYQCAAPHTHVHSTRTNRQQKNNEGGYTHIPSSFFPLSTAPASLSANATSRPERKLKQQITAHPERSLYQNFEQMNLSHFGLLLFTCHPCIIYIYLYLSTSLPISLSLSHLSPTLSLSLSSTQNQLHKV